MRKVIRDFECAMCGRCCASQDLVQLTSYELYRLARHLEIEPAEFFSRYCVIASTTQNPTLHLYIKTEDGKCPFLKDNKCSVHEARPYACMAYPMRVYWSLTEDMKAFVRSKYPDLEKTCSLFKLNDGDVLLGDYELLSRQTLAWWVDDAYFSMAGEMADLSIPYRVADFYIHDEEMMEAAKRYVVNPYHPPSAFGAELAYARISLALQAAIWNATASFVRVKGQEAKEDERQGRFILLTTDADSAKALGLLVEGGRLDLARTLAMASIAYEGRHVIASVHGSSSDHIAIGFIFHESGTIIRELTDDGKKPLYIFFKPETGDEVKLVGFPLNIKI